MSSMFAPLSQNKTLSIMPTFQCTAECRHCGTVSSPRENTWLEQSHVLASIEQAAELGYKVVVFTGGEPTLAGENLLAAIEKAASHKMAVRIVTNAHWAITDEAAFSFIEKLIAHGLKEINFSTGDQHARFVPVDNIIRATRQSVKVGLNVAIMIETVKERKITKEHIENRSEFSRILIDYPSAVIKIHESPWMPLAPRNISQYPEGMAINRENLSACKGCDSILSTTTIQADGIIGACCGLGMRLIPELHVGKIGRSSIAEADNTASDDFLKRWIRVEGPEKILAWAATHDPSIEWEDMYAHRCQACVRLYKDSKVRRVISEHHREKMADVLFAEWLLFHYDGSHSAPSNASITW